MSAICLSFVNTDKSSQIKYFYFVNHPTTAHWRLVKTGMTPQLTESWSLFALIFVEVTLYSRGIFSIVCIQGMCKFYLF